MKVNNTLWYIALTCTTILATMCFMIGNNGFAIIMGTIAASITIMMVWISIYTSNKLEKQVDVLLPYSRVLLNSEEGQEILNTFIKNNGYENDDKATVAMKLIETECDIVFQEMNDYYDTLRSAMPNPWD